jgi:hypothetical protein
MKKIEILHILYDTRTIDLDDGSPCWCCMPVIHPEAKHEEYCTRAREATVLLWKLGPLLDIMT